MVGTVSDVQQAALAANSGVAAARPAASGSDGPSIPFLDVLSALNPLQYLPVVGTIYRAVTGNTIPEPIRMAGSLVVSGLMGGPIGVLTNIATTIAEKATGIDPERIGRSVLAQLGSTLGLTTPATSTVVASAPQTPVPASLSFTTVAAATPPRSAWTRAELAAYGISTKPDGSLQQGNLEGADVLNAMELSRLHAANAAYARAMNVTSARLGHA
jgi:hypothetical protein